jgi:thiamine-monophosphate kinase
VGEHEVVKAVALMLRDYWECESLSLGDDAACAGSEGFWDQVVVKIDGGSIASNMAPWMSLYDLGWVMVTGAISDVVAKAAAPVTVQVSVGVPSSMRADKLLALIRGARDSALAHQAWLSGGDTNSSRDGWVDVAVVGLALPRWGPLPRRPSAGDAVYTTVGRYGLMGALLHSLKTGVWESLYKAYKSVFVEASRPYARLGFAHLAARVVEGCISGSVDVSDGLAYSLHLLAENARASLVVFEPPRPHSFAELYSAESGAKLEDLVFYGGQEYEVVFTVKPECKNIVEEEARRLGLEVQEIGRIVEGTPQVKYKNRQLEPIGWDNFKSYDS